MPRIVADENFVGLGVLSSDEYTGGSGGADEWYINQVRLNSCTFRTVFYLHDDNGEKLYKKFV